MKTPCDTSNVEVWQSGRDNPPNLLALAYRAGVHPTFVRRMLARLPTQAIPDGPHQGSRPLAALGTRDGDDPAIALLDGWAAVLDVLTFYQERIANEGFLRTAIERRSVLELARAIGYELSPGVAATTFLAFTVEDAPGAPGVALVPKGTQVQSVPGQAQLPQTFETLEDIESRAEWNALRPQLTEPQAINSATTELYLKGTDVQLRPGDVVLIVGDEWKPGSERWDLRVLQTVTPHPGKACTHLTWKNPLWHEESTVEPNDSLRVFAFRQRAALFGHNAPDWQAMPESVKKAYDPTLEETEWPGFEIGVAGDGPCIDLDAVYPRILEESWIVLVKPSYTQLYRATKVTAASRTNFALTAKITRIELDTGQQLPTGEQPPQSGLRDTAVFAQSEQLELAERPITTPVAGNEIVLDCLTEDLEPGQLLSVSGKRIRQAAEPAADDAETVSEVALVEAVADDGGRTTITLSQPLQNAFDCTTVAICANVVRATHGETAAREVLGSGDGAQSNQRFTLKKKHLTHIATPDAAGAGSALEIRVNDVRWRQVPSLYGLGPNDQCYTVRIDDDGRATVTFGDGRVGARLPSGQENVVAVYRTGIGPEGEVDAGSLTLLKSRPLGIRSVTNPLPARGAAPPDTLELARANAPLAALTIDRLVSLRDFQDFALAFAGIGKARAVALWSGETRIVHVTVAGAGGDRVQRGTPLYESLVRAIDDRRDPDQPVAVDSYERVEFDVEATVWVDPCYAAANVLTELEVALRTTFAFERRALGQTVTVAEVISEMHKVSGVVAVDLDRPSSALLAAAARWDRKRNEVRPAQLLLLNPKAAGVTLTAMEHRP